MPKRRCASCGQSFQPRPQVPKQAYCSSPKCQRARKLRWQHDKLQNDLDYQGNQRDAQRAWQKRNSEYWRNYRATHPEYAERNRNRQSAKPSNSKRPKVAKMDVSELPNGFPAGLYRIRPITGSGPAKSGAWIAEITPMCLDCHCKKDACKEMT